MAFIDPTTPAGVQPNGFSSGFTLVFSEEFNSSTLDATKWRNYHDFADKSASSAWDIDAGGNSALRMWWNGNTSTDNQMFVSNGTTPFRKRFGFYEARMKCASGKGWFPGFWLYPVSNTGGENADGQQQEIDIVEWFAYENGDWLVNTTSYQAKNAKLTIWTEGGGGATSTAGNIKLSDPRGSYDNTISTAYHTYGLHWTAAGGLKWYYDGVLMGTVNDPWGASNTMQLCIILQLWWGPNGGIPVPASGATPTTASNTTSQLFDYVRVWDIGTTPPPVGPTWKIMPLGDSITEGQSATANYRDRLADLLVADSISAGFYGSLATNTSALPSGFQKHEGHSSWCSTDAGGICQQGNTSYDPSRPIGILERIDSWLVTNPVNMVLLLIGLNDGSNATVQSAVGSIIDKILAANSATKILVSTVRTYGNPQTNRNAAITAACSGKANTTVVDAYAGWVDATDFSSSTSDHPSVTGYQRMADNWFAAIQAAIAPGAVFNAAVSQAPANGATISGFVMFEVAGDLIENCELLPPSGYLPLYGSFTINAAKTIATLLLDTSTLPNGTFSARISAYNQPSGSTNPTTEIVAMTTRTWTINNIDPGVMPVCTIFDIG